MSHFQYITFQYIYREDRNQEASFLSKIGLPFGNGTGQKWEGDNDLIMEDDTGSISF